MPIAPLDLQVNIAQMANVAAQQQAAQGHPILQQEHMGVKAVEQAKIDREKVAIIEKAEGKRIEGDKKGGSGGYFGGRRREKPPEERKGDEEREDLDPHRGHFIDVTK